MFLAVQSVWAQHSRFATTDSRSQYSHWIELRDASGNVIDPADPKASPYSPVTTCGKCHDYKAIAGGHHFNANQDDVAPGRSGEPWIWTDVRTGTHIPLSYRGWEGTFRPDALGITPFQFVQQFGHHLPGGGPGVPEAAEVEAEQQLSARWKLTGSLDIDCLLCHSADPSYAPHLRAGHVGQQNFAWTATAAAGLARIDGSVKRLPDDFDPAKAADRSTGPGLPKTVYRQARFVDGNKVFVDVTRKPSTNACYFCHTVRPVGEEAGPEWTRDEDVHVEAGLSCCECHANGIEHDTVRGFPNESHPAGTAVATLTCRGCHLGAGETLGAQGGHFAAPRPLHKGLPPLHLEKLSCTACHAGPLPGEHPLRVQTSLAHELGISAHRDEQLPPPIVEPVFVKNAQGVIEPCRMTWPAFWGMMNGDRVTPLNPEEAYSTLRRVLRVRRDFREELTRVRLTAEDKISVLGEERAKVAPAEMTEAEKKKIDDLTESKKIEVFLEKLAAALKALEENADGSTPVYISAGKAYRLGSDGSAEVFEHPAAKPYVWPMGHDVRPASESLGANGCTDCHSDGAPIFYGTVTALGPAPDSTPISTTMHELEGLDAELLAVWNQSFQGRSAFKWFAFAAVGLTIAVLVLFIFVGLNGIINLVFRRRA